MLIGILLVLTWLVLLILLLTAAGVWARRRSGRLDGRTVDPGPRGW